MVAYTRSLSHRDTVRPALWAHVPLTTLFAQDNTVTKRANGTLVCGHEPWHGSRSGQCVILWPVEGRWWCSACRQGGDAITYTMMRHGCDYATAAQWLGERYGFPKRWWPGVRERLSWPRPYVAVGDVSAPTYLSVAEAAP